MDTYNTVRLRLITLCDEKHFSLHKLALSSGIAPSTLKNILYGKSKNPGIVTIKLLVLGRRYRSCGRSARRR